VAREAAEAAAAAAALAAQPKDPPQNMRAVLHPDGSFGIALEVRALSCNLLQPASGRTSCSRRTQYGDVVTHACAIHARSSGHIRACWNQCTMRALFSDSPACMKQHPIASSLRVQQQLANFWTPAMQHTSLQV